MASFKTHVSGGTAVGMAVGAISLLLGISSYDFGWVILLAVAVIAGSVAPDIDSDSSIPFHMTFGTLSLLVAVVSAVPIWRLFAGEWLLVIGLPVAIALTVWFVVGLAFRKVTHHRGMVHSLPAGVLAGLIIFLVGTRIGLTEWQAWLLSVAFCVGYLLHLVLDEIYAAVNFQGLRIVPKKSFGSALKLFSHSRSANFVVYAAIAVIVLSNQNRLTVLAGQLASFVS
ncbi:MAG: metal-dependent hydrolase [Patescibacteria group bacterium]